VRGLRVVLLMLAGSAGYVGGWALLAPGSFFTSFPGLGRRWLVVDGPFNEHLVRDVGALYLALLVLTAAAVRRPERALVRLVGTAWLVFSVPHLIYHAAHLRIHDAADRLANLASLGGTVLLAAAVCLWPAPAGDRSDVTGSGRASSSS